VAAAVAVATSDKFPYMFSVLCVLFMKVVLNCADDVYVQFDAQVCDCSVAVVTVITLLHDRVCAVLHRHMFCACYVA
jgi:hypothetical protein